MTSKINKYAKQLQKEIDRTEERLLQADAELKKALERNPNIILEFGLAKYAEDITKLHAKLDALYEQQDRFNCIFELVQD